MDIREEFEKLDEIKTTLEKYDGYRVGNKYSTYDTSATAWMNGAWYAFQEQQKKIDSVIFFTLRYQPCFHSILYKFRDAFA